MFCWGPNSNLATIGFLESTWTFQDLLGDPPAGSPRAAAVGPLLASHRVPYISPVGGFKHYLLG